MFVVYFRYTSSTNKFNLGCSITFSMAAMMKSTKSSPSTNFPIVCPTCTPELALVQHLPLGHDVNLISKKKKTMDRPAVWKYNMLAHYASVHGGIDHIPDGLALDLTVSDNEKLWLNTTKGLKAFK